MRAWPLGALVGSRRGLQPAMMAFALILCAPAQAADRGVATVVDTAASAPSGATVVFFVGSVDSVDVRNALGIGAHPTARGPGDAPATPVERRVTSGKVMLNLLGRRQPGPPTEAEVMVPERLHGVGGSVTVELKPDGRYRITGVLDGQRREVWVEDVASGQVVGKKVVDSPNDSERADAAAADRFTCCNLHVADRWISDGNYAELPFIPAGARVRISGFGRNRVHVNVEGRPATAGIDSETARSREELAELLFVKSDPRQRLMTMPPEVRAAVMAGRVMPGMSREQVILSLGYPRPDRTPDLAARRWVYFMSEREEFDIDFDATDRLLRINAPTRIKQAVWHAP